MEPIPFAIIGGGWRAEFFLRVARALPERFRVSGILARSAEKGERLTREWGVPTVRTLDDLLREKPLFAVVSVPWAVSPQMLTDLTDRGVPALAETPPAPDLNGLIAVNRLTARGGRIQVAEQYHLQPLHAARLRLAASGRLGRVSQAQVSVCHGYHGISLLRRLLGIGFENASLTARRFVSPLVAGPGRDGPPAEERVGDSSQTLAWLDFGERLGVFDFTGDQYFSWIRGQRVLVRGDRGEIQDEEVRYLEAFDTPVSYSLRRMNAGENGNLEGLYLKGILGGAEWLYRNPFIPARLTDDEIAVASCLDKMAEYAQGGDDFYSLAEASQDHYLSMMLQRAEETGAPLLTETQPWA